MMRLVVATVLLFNLVACAADKTAQKSEPKPTVGEQGLTVTRDGSDTYEFHDAVAECAMSDAGAGDTELVQLLAPADHKHALRNGKIVEPFLRLQVVPGITGRREFPLEERAWDEGPPDVSLFGGDPRERNEVSGSVEVATGHLTIIEATCDPEPRVAFTIRATLGSELSDGRSVHIWGGIEAGETRD